MVKRVISINLHVYRIEITADLIKMREIFKMELKDRKGQMDKFVQKEWVYSNIILVPSFLCENYSFIIGFLREKIP